MLSSESSNMSRLCSTVFVYFCHLFDAFAFTAKALADSDSEQPITAVGSQAGRALRPCPGFLGPFNVLWLGAARVFVFTFSHN